MLSNLEFMNTYTGKSLVRIILISYKNMPDFWKRMSPTAILNIKYWEKTPNAHSRDFRLFMEEIQQLNMNNRRKLQSHFV